MGLHADPSFLEVTGKGIAVKGANALVTPSDPKGVGMIASFPTDELGAVTLTGLGKIAGAFYTSFTKTGDPTGLRLVLAGMGIDSATQIETLLGAETGVVVGGTKDVPQLAVRVRSGDSDGAYELARRVLDAAQLDTEVVTVRKVTGPGGIVFGTRPADNTFDLTGAISGGYGPRLDSTEAFRQVMPDVSKATFATYVNLDKVLPLLHATSSKYVPSLKPLDALGVTVTAGAEPTLRLRLSVR
jgi:hypothetical protein